MADPFNLVAQGREGTGAAFILNGNRAAEIFQQNIQADEQARRLAEFQRQKALRERENLIDTNLGKVALKDHWIAHDEELRNKYNGLMQYGAELKIKGVNPASDPTFRDLNNQLDSEALYSGKIASAFDAFQKEISTNRDKYSDESIAQTAAYFDPKKPLAQYMQEGMVPPTLKPRYTLSGMLKGVKGSSTEYDKSGRIIKEADRGANVKIVEGLMDTPDFKNFVKEQGGDPTIGAFPTQQNGKTIYSTRDEVLLPIVNEYLDAMTPEEYRNLGLKATTKEEAQQEMLDTMKRQNAAYGSVISTAADQLDAGVDNSNRRDWSADSSARGWENIRLRKQQMARQAAKDNKEATDEKYLTTLKNGLRTGDAEALRRFNGFISDKRGKAKYVKGGLIIDIPKDDKQMNDAFSAFMGNKTTVKENGKSFTRYAIGSSTGQSGDIILDNIFKQVGLLKKNTTPDQYSGEFDSVGDDETFDDL